MTMHGRIAQAIDENRLGKDGSAGRGLESRLVDERAQVVLIRQPLRRVVLVEPMHHHFQPAPCVEACRPRIRMSEGFRLGSGLKQVRPFSF
jgi:hypothetical protein